MINKTKTKNIKEINKEYLLIAISYLPMLFLIPLFVKKGNQLAQHHAKQGLVLFLFEVIINFIAIIPILGWIIAFIGWSYAFLMIVLGVLHTLEGEYWEMPFLGKYKNLLN